jgi:short-subunit dehydrogenase
VLSFSEALSCELEGTGVSVTVLCPGPTETGFVLAGGAEDSSLFKGKKVMSATEAAGTGYRAMMKGQSLVIAGLKNTLLVFSVRFSPRWMLPRIVKSMQARAH